MAPSDEALEGRARLAGVDGLQPSRGRGAEAELTALAPDRWLDRRPRLDKVWHRPPGPGPMRSPLFTSHRRLRGSLATALISAGGFGGALMLAAAPGALAQATVQAAAPVPESVVAGNKGAQVYCFMRNNGNIHEVSWAAAYALVKRQGSSVFKTSPEHAAVMITETVVQNPNLFPDCGRYLGDLYTRRQTVVITSGPGTIPAGAVPVGVGTGQLNNGGQTRW